MDKSIIFKSELDTIINDDVKEFATLLLDEAPDYLYTVAASSSGRYHPQYALGKQGLVRHEKAALRFLNHILSLEQYEKDFTEREIDLMRVAILYHDAHKQGDGKSSHTVFEHPVIAANAVRNYIGKYLNENELEFIAGCIETHMGSWNTNKKSRTELPKPHSEAHKFVHLCDYLASRKDIEILFDEYEKPEPPKIEDYEMGFGKFKGVKIKEAFAQEKSYFDWLMSQDKFPVREPLKGFVKQLMKGE